jgi:hypothetical protein
MPKAEETLSELVNQQRHGRNARRGRPAVLKQIRPAQFVFEFAQLEWLHERAAERGVSVSQQVRDCIDAAREGVTKVKARGAKS